MTQEDRELLFKDLSARLPYGVKIQYSGQVCKLVTINDDCTMLCLGEDGYRPNIEDELFADIEAVKPYLRPMSSMTKEETATYIDEEIDADGFIYHDDIKSIDFLNSIHVDYRGLIEKGLAIEVTEDNNPYKE